MADLTDKELLQAIIGKLYDYSLNNIKMRLYISPQDENKYHPDYKPPYRVVICPFKDGYRGAVPDIPNMTILYSQTVPFTGTKDMKAHEIMPIVHRILTGEERDGAEGKWLTRDTDR